MPNIRRTASIALIVGGSVFLSHVSDAQFRRRPRTRPAVRQGPRGANRGIARPAERWNVGDKAPDFTLKTVDGKKSVTLSSFRGHKPVVLIFGSYT